MPRKVQDEANEQQSQHSQSKESPQQQLPSEQFVIPSSKKTLRACLRCGLVKTKSQWQQMKACQNCGTFDRMETSENTSANFHGVIAVIDVARSFARKKAKVYSRNGQKIKSALYGF